MMKWAFQISRAKMVVMASFFATAFSPTFADSIDNPTDRSFSDLKTWIHSNLKSASVQRSPERREQYRKLPPNKHLELVCLILEDDPVTNWESKNKLISILNAETDLSNWLSWYLDNAFRSPSDENMQKVDRLQKVLDLSLFIANYTQDESYPPMGLLKAIDSRPELFFQTEVVLFVLRQTRSVESDLSKLAGGSLSKLLKLRHEKKIEIERLYRPNNPPPFLLDSEISNALVAIVNNPKMNLTLRKETYALIERYFKASLPEVWGFAWSLDDTAKSKVLQSVEAVLYNSALRAAHGQSLDSISAIFQAQTPKLNAKAGDDIILNIATQLQRDITRWKDGYPIESRFDTVHVVIPPPVIKAINIQNFNVKDKNGKITVPGYCAGFDVVQPTLADMDFRETGKAESDESIRETLRKAVQRLDPSRPTGDRRELKITGFTLKSFVSEYGPGIATPTGINPLRDVIKESQAACHTFWGSEVQILPNALKFDICAWRAAAEQLQKGYLLHARYSVVPNIDSHQFSIVGYARHKGEADPFVLYTWDSNYPGQYGKIYLIYPKENERKAPQLIYRVPDAQNTQYSFLTLSYSANPKLFEVQTNCKSRAEKI